MFGIQSIRHPQLNLFRCTSWIGEKPGEWGTYTFWQSLTLWRFAQFSFGGLDLQTGHRMRSLDLKWLGHTLQLSIMYRVEG